MANFRYLVVAENKVVAQMKRDASGMNEAIGFGLALAAEIKAQRQLAECDGWLVDIVDENDRWVISLPFDMARRPQAAA